MQQHNTSNKNSPGITNKAFSGVLKLYYCPHSETKILLVQHSKTYSSKLVSVTQSDFTNL